MRSVSLTIAAVILLFGACHKIPKEPGCPETLLPSDSCKYPFQICLDPRSVCKTTSCQCLEQKGGHGWKCTLQYCLCTCPCGVAVRSTCDAVGCVDNGGACPAMASDICAQHCKDGGAVDAGSDALVDAIDDGARADGKAADSATDAPVKSDSKVDVTTDTAVIDAKSDTRPDQGKDAPVSDAAKDALEDSAVDAPVDAKQDAPMDAPNG